MSSASISHGAARQNPAPGFVLRSECFGDLDAEAGLLEQVCIRFGTEMTPPHRRAPAGPVRLLAFPGAQRPGCEEVATGAEPAMNAAQQRTVLLTRHMDDRMQRQH